MVEIVYKSHGDALDYALGVHVLTFAEQGFAPLDIHGRRFGVDRDTLVAFADAVNRADEVGSLHPQAPISAVPRSCIRDAIVSGPLLGHLQGFIASTADNIQACRLLLDFSTPRLEKHVEEAIAIVFGRPVSSQIEEIIVIRN
jgi:hypothetical protein